MKPLKFKTVLTKADDSGWHFILVDRKRGKRFEKDGSRRIVCTINGTESFQCALNPWGDTYSIIVNKTKRDRLGIVAGDKIEVELKADESKYGLPMPAELKEVFRQDREADKLFHALTPGKQRSVLYLIGKINDIDRRIHAALIFVEHIKKNEGKIVGDELYHELKRPIF